jgi:hypothetical protein
MAVVELAVLAATPVPLQFIAAVVTAGAFMLIFIVLNKLFNF